MIESQNIEFKESWRDEYLKSICAFANTQGGKIFIGKNDLGKDIGIPNAQRLLEDLPNKVLTNLGVLVDVNLIKNGSINVIEIVIEQYPYPIGYRGHYYIRSGSTTQELRGLSLDKFLLEKAGKRWDGINI